MKTTDYQKAATKLANFSFIMKFLSNGLTSKGFSSKDRLPHAIVMLVKHA